MITYTLVVLYIFDMSLAYSTNKTYNLKHDQEVLPRVYNGWPAKLGDVPYQVSFKRRNMRGRSYSSFCGGVIVAHMKLLSAAHCFVDGPRLCAKLCGGGGKVQKKMLSHTFAVAGQLTNVARRPYGDNYVEGQWRRLTRVRYPAEYSFPRLDFAIVFLMSPFRFDNYVNSIPYASKFVNYEGQCLVSGFGRTSRHTNSDKLLLAHLTLIDWKKCSNIHRKFMRHFVCTSSQYTDVGKGDSGGPLVCSGTGDPQDRGRGVLVGIVSGHARGMGSFFTRVSSFYNYIERNKSSTTKDSYIYLILLLNLIHWRFLLF